MTAISVLPSHMTVTELKALLAALNRLQATLQATTAALAAAKAAHDRAKKGTQREHSRN